MHFCHHMQGKVKSSCWPRCYKTFAMLNSTEHAILTASKSKLLKGFSCAQALRCCIYHAYKC